MPNHKEVGPIPEPRLSLSGDGAARTALFRSGALALTLVLALAAISMCGATEIWPEKRSQIRYENRLLTGLIEHHQMASALASLGKDRAVHSELLNLSAIITWSLRSEISDLRLLLSDWQGIDYEPRVTRQDQRTIDRLTELSGEAFEIAFMTELIKLDTSALRLGRDCERRAIHQELKDTCRRLEESQQAEINQMRQWLCDWYARCVGVSPDDDRAK